MKECFKCGAEKPLTEFYKHRGMADGHLNKCKDCARKDSTTHRNKNLERARAYDRMRGNRQSPDYHKMRKSKYPKKYKATCMVNNYVRDGKLEKPSACEQCGSSFRIEGHHDDYDKPLDVRWLCSACHSQWHRDNGEGKNAA